MLKLIIGFERQAALSRAQCHDYLRDSHAALVASVEDFNRHLRAYTQNFADGEWRRGASEFDLDGVAELWFDDLAGFVTAFSEPRYLELVRPDELHFADPERLLCACTQAQLRWDDGNAGPFKLMRFLAPRAPGRGAGVQLWKQAYPALIAGAPQLRQSVGKYVQNWSLSDAGEAFSGMREVAGVDELWFSAGADIGAFLALEQALLKEQGKDFQDIDLDGSVSFIGRERVVTSPGV